MVVLLVDAEQPQQMWRDLVWQRAGLALLKERAQVISLAQDSALPNIETLCQGIRVQEASLELKVGV